VQSRGPKARRRVTGDCCKTYRDLCGRAIKPVRLTSSTNKLKDNPPDQVIATGLMARRHRTPENYLSHVIERELSLRQTLINLRTESVFSHLLIGRGFYSLPALRPWLTAPEFLCPRNVHTPGPFGTFSHEMRKSAERGPNIIPGVGLAGRALIFQPSEISDQLPRQIPLDTMHWARRVIEVKTYGGGVPSEAER
jgi:hypothetical protein